MRHRVSPGGSSRVWKKRVRVEKALGEQNLPSIEFQKNRVYTTTFLPSKWNSKKKSFIYPHLPSFHREFKKKSFIYPHLPSFHREFKKKIFIYPHLPSFHREFKIKGFISQPSFLPLGIKNQSVYIPTFHPSIGNSKPVFTSPFAFLP